MINEKQVKGFTLLELLIVIAILSVLAMALILVLNPAETLKKSRDSQRMSDLATVKTALGLYLTNTSSAFLGGTDNVACKAGGAWDVVNDKIFYSTPIAYPITDTGLDGVTFAIGATQVADTNIGKTDGNGWIPVNLSALTSGSPISNFPVDPTNKITNLNDVSGADLVYRYVCDADNLTYEIDANLESTEFAAKEGSDGGNNPDMYEVGTKLDILGGGTDF